ncbi:DUF305 domain-containing protein [Herbiconiux flava]|uniref:Uncharacterized protein (DUF305 family) n=1 Tax=Herbiconiux flava TaxID=881268 RepID=A0A852SMK2_9MICO|nr:DUF305 domain-containing protein [Herbiconiux flava]NYD70039.1 uncharacterized protein (DUF305 family) [Herbiconiux flava]GLK16789.1 DUF305 domain-containing protein [Herbiconiux flava]
MPDSSPADSSVADPSLADPSVADSSPATAAPDARRPSRGRLTLAAIVAAVLVAIVAFSAGWLAAPRTATPTDTGVEAGFARNMQTHHDQAVQMALIIREQSDDPAIRSLAYDIATSQAQQSGQMYAWLNAWGLPQASTQPEMTWMLQPTLDGSDGHGHGGAASPTAASDATGDAAAGDTAAGTPAPMVPGEPMPGMATSADLDRLSSLTGVEAETLFLQLMIAHHQGGVEMAEAALSRTTNPLVTALAKAIVFAQSGEIQYMQELLAART